MTDNRAAWHRRTEDEKMKILGKALDFTAYIYHLRCLQDPDLQVETTEEAEEEPVKVEPLPRPPSGAEQILAFLESNGPATGVMIRTSLGIREHTLPNQLLRLKRRELIRVVACTKGKQINIYGLPHQTFPVKEIRTS